MSNEQIIDFQLDQLDDSPTQPRTTYDQAALEELAETMRPPLGRVQQPIVVRMAKGRGQIVFGHRRTRAARLAGLTTIPAIVREMTDEEVEVAQIVENLQREGVSPLDEADALHRLRTEHNANVEELMQKSGKSRSYVYNRLRLATAHDDIREALIVGDLDPEIAVEIARLPKPLQPKAYESVGGMSYRWAKQELQNHFQFKLASAPFEQRSIKLLPSAGACDACPKRSDAEPVLLQECGANVCMDGECYGKKATLHREAEEKKAKAAADKAAKAGKAAPGADLQRDLADYRAAERNAAEEDARSEEEDDYEERPDTRTPEEKAVTENWREINLAMMRLVASRPRTTDDMRLLLERELDLGDSDFGQAEEVLGWEFDEDGEAPRRAKLATMMADELGTLLMLVALQTAPWSFYNTGKTRAEICIGLAKRIGIDVLTAQPLAAEPASTPSPAAPAPKKAKAAQAVKKAKPAKTKSKGEEQKDEDGSAGDRDPLTRDMLAEAGL